MSGGGTKRTQDQTAPARPSEGSVGREALVVAFPRPSVFPVPVSGEPIGRDWFAEHGLDDEKASRQHAVFSRAGGVLRVGDAGSRNGTWIDGVRLPEREFVAIEDGSLLRIGRTLLVYRRQFRGPDAASPDLGGLVAPYGLRLAFHELDSLAERRSSPTNVLIHGETGTGKEALANEVARRFGRPTPRAINMAAVPATIFESMLFGHAKGSFSGAASDAPGILKENDGGAVFLDELGELPLELQPKLLRFLENRQLEAVGSTKARSTDVLVVAATNRKLDEDRFRADLLARFSTLTLPPLRARVEDIFSIAQAVLRREGRAYDARHVEIEAIERLLLHAWRKNVRELAHTLAAIARSDPPPSLRKWAVEAVLGESESSPGPVTSDRAREAVKQHGSEVKAAEALGLSRGSLRRVLGKGR